MQKITDAQSNRRYQLVSNEKAEGATYTPSNLAGFVASEMITSATFTGSELRILDPAVGDGELLYNLLKKLSLVSGDTPLIVYGFDTNPDAVSTALQRLAESFPNVEFHIEVNDFLAVFMEKTSVSISLFPALGEAFEFDLIIANPPYVRTQIMGAQYAQQLATTFGLNGRVDLYHAFLLAISKVLKPTGTAGIIVSNRFMTTKGGATLRAALRAQLGLRHIWDLGDTKIFDAAVLPAVILADGLNGHELPTPIFTSIYETSQPAELEANDPIDALALSGNIKLSNGKCFRVQHGKLDSSGDQNDLWRIATNASDSWLLTVSNHTWRTFGDIGKIRVGVKTCADKIFISSNWYSLAEDERPELLRPLTTHHIARRFRALSSKKPRGIIYPHQSVDGQRQAIDLANYPVTRSYLEENKTALEARTYVIQGGRRWYELWVPQDPAAWDAPKLVFRDISERPTFWVDLDGTIVNGDCYWMIAEKENSTDLLWLAAAVANSTFIEAFYDHRFNNKLYAGRRRFMTQYVEQFPLPNPDSLLAQKIVEITKELYKNADSVDVESELEQQLDALVWQAFGLPIEEIAG